MIYRTVETARGIEWLAAGARLLRMNPGPFVLMALALTIVGLVPLLGGLVLLVFGPALLGGVVYAVREVDVGRRADFQHLFQVFRAPGKLGPMLLLCLPGVGATLALVAVGLLLAGTVKLGSEMAPVGASGAGIALSLGGGIVLFLVLALGLSVVVVALMFFALPRVMLDDAEPWAAMKDSAFACLANPGAVLLFLALVYTAIGLAFYFLHLVSPLLAGLLVGLATYPVYAAASYFASLDVFAAGGMPTPTPPANFDD